MVHSIGYTEKISTSFEAPNLRNVAAPTHTAHGEDEKSPSVTRN